MASKQEATDPKVVAAAMKRVVPLVRKLPKALRLPAPAIANAALHGVTVVRRNKSSQENDGPIVFGGDLVIAGSFDLGCTCIVLGDLHVDGVIEAMHDAAALIVGGSIKARGINCTDQVLAAGSITAEVIFVELMAKLGAGRGITADLVILEDKTVKVDGKLRTKERVVLTYPDATGIAHLASILEPKAFGVVRDNLYDYTNLFSVLRRGKPWRSSGKAKADKLTRAKTTKGDRQRS